MGWAGWAECLAGCLTNLEELRVGGAAATDFDLMALRPLTRLTALDVCDSQDVRARLPSPPLLLCFAASGPHGNPNPSPDSCVTRLTALNVCDSQDATVRFSRCSRSSDCTASKSRNSDLMHSQAFLNS